MEDEGFVDDDFIAATAEDYIGRYGANSLAVLHERAELAAKAGDYLLVETWRRIVEAAEDVLAAGFWGDAG